MVYFWMINSTGTVTFMDDKNICHRIDLNFIQNLVEQHLALSNVG